MTLNFNLWWCFKLVVLAYVCCLIMPKLGAFLLVLGFSLYFLRSHFNKVNSIFLLAFFINYGFILCSFNANYQYDYFNFFMQSDYIIQNNFFLDDLKGYYMKSVYFQPPLWGVLSAMITKFTMFFHYDIHEGFDFVRFLSLFAVLGSGVIFYRVMCFFEIKEFYRFWLFLLFLFYPIHTIMGNLVNNDAMVYFIMLSTVWYFLLWYENQNIKNTLRLAFCLFLSGMIKFSGLMVVPAIGGAMIYLWFVKRLFKETSFYIQVAIFLVSTLLGAFWGIFLIYHNLPLVPPLQGAEYQSMRLYSLFDRVVSFETILYPFVDIKKGLLEVNIFASLVKTGLFGEWPWGSLFWGNLLYVIGWGFFLVSLVLFFSLVAYSLKCNMGYNIFFIVYILSVVGSWGTFLTSYPYFCSTEFRYVAVLGFLLPIVIGNYFTKKHLPKVFDYALAGVITIFVFAKIMLYLSTIELF